MKEILQIIPFALLLIATGWIVWRGIRTKPDATDNKARGGGSASHNIGPD